MGQNVFFSPKIPQKCEKLKNAKIYKFNRKCLLSSFFAMRWFSMIHPCSFEVWRKQHSPNTQQHSTNLSARSQSAVWVQAFKPLALRVPPLSWVLALRSICIKLSACVQPVTYFLAPPIWVLTLRSVMTCFRHSNCWQILVVWYFYSFRFFIMMF